MAEPTAVDFDLIKIKNLDDGSEISLSSIVLNDDGEFQLDGHTFEVIKKEVLPIETEVEVIVHTKETRSSSPVEVDAEFARVMRRQQRNIIAEQRKSSPSGTVISSVSYGHYNLPPALKPVATSPKETLDTPKFNPYLVARVQQTAAHQNPIEPSSPVPVNEEIVTPTVVIRKNYAEAFLNLINRSANDDGIVWTPIENVENKSVNLRNGHGSEDTVDRQSIIDNKDTTKEFLMGKMLESIEYDANSSSLARGDSNLNLLNVANGLQNGSNNRHSYSREHSEVESSIVKKTEIFHQMSYNEVIQDEKPKAVNTDRMQLVSARPCFVVDNEFPSKVAELGTKKTTAQKSAEAMIAKEIEEMKLREAELLRIRVGTTPTSNSPSPIELEVSKSNFSFVKISSPSTVSENSDLKLNGLPDILVNPPPVPLSTYPVNAGALPSPLSTHPVNSAYPSVPLLTHPVIGPLSPLAVSPFQVTRSLSPLSDNLLSAPLSPALSDSVKPMKVADRTQERVKVRPLSNDSDDEDSTPRYKFHKETAVERDIRLAMQREEELRKEKQQTLQKTSAVTDMKVVAEKRENKSPIKIESQFIVVPQPNITTAKTSSVVTTVKRQPPSKLILSESIVNGRSSNSNGVSNGTTYCEIAEIHKAKMGTQEAPAKKVERQINAENDVYRSVPLSAPPTSKSFQFVQNVNNIYNEKSLNNGSDKQTGTLPNRNTSKGIMAQFFKNSGRKSTVFVPKTTVPAVQPTYVSPNVDTKTANVNTTTTVESEIENQNPILSPKFQFKRGFSTVENKILDELKEMQGREKELRAERSRLAIQIKESNEDENVNFNGQAFNTRVDTVSGAWGIFTIIENDTNGHSEA
ncbi:hypothetical protein CHUAL_012971 [Chamberlinius hualienensis]